MMSAYDLSVSLSDDDPRRLQHGVSGGHLGSGMYPTDCQAMSFAASGLARTFLISLAHLATEAVNLG